MKSLIQSFLICGGIVGLIFLGPIGLVAWKFQRGFGRGSDSAMTYLPLACVAALVAGVVWIRITKKKEPPHTSSQSTDEASEADE